MVHPGIPFSPTFHLPLPLVSFILNLRYYHTNGLFEHICEIIINGYLTFFQLDISDGRMVCFQPFWFSSFMIYLPAEDQRTHRILEHQCVFLQDNTISTPTILTSLIFQPDKPFSPIFHFPLPFVSFILYPEILPMSFSDGGFTVTEALSLILPFCALQLHFQE